jgi:cephalosporin hydroxylase
MVNMLKRAVQIAKEEGFLSLTKGVYRHIYYNALSLFGTIEVILFKRHFYQSINQLKSLADLLNFAYSFRVFGLTLRPFQIKEEILKLLELLKDMEPKVVLEIGTAEGGTLLLFTRVASSDATIISIDLPSGMFGGGYPAWKIPLYKSFAREKQKIYLIRADSHSYKTVDKVKEILNGRSVDFLFIDGDHTYEGVKKDFEMYSPLVKKGIIAFHDIVPGPPEYVGGVPKFWGEVKMKYKHLEIVKDWHQGGYGIGVIYV